MNDYISVTDRGMVTEREKKRRLRAEVTAWQRAAIGLLILSIAVNFAQYRMIEEKARESANWENRYTAAATIERQAVQAYGELLQEVEAERTAREKQTEAYEAVGRYSYAGVFTVTYYCSCEICCGKWADGITATGLPAGPGIVAVDPEVVPLGSTVIIDGVQYLAADTGVTGNHIDICVEDHALAEELGVGMAEVWVDGNG